ncbi:Laminin A family protein [Histomonas meleagridis]|uniref:Laminin A family protein n=1 Tax=Histomonas meleagridis TaxID=135588 RepID=UPI003559FE5C|nr:Laminin A family protein [Histomonas meleagridis]KAH0806275.1 Laminin A family protein [Histomonas meleagridis]
MLLHLLLQLTVSEVLYNVTSATCYKVNGAFTLKKGVDKNATGAVAYAVYNNSIHAVGWYKMHITGIEGNDDADIMYCTGFLEGYLAHEGIYNHYNLIKDIKGYPRGQIYPPKIHDFIEANYNYTKLSVEAYLESPYWQKVGLILQQFHGIVAGYDFAISESGHPEQNMSLFDHWFFQSAGDMFDIAAIFKDDKPAKEFREHCTGLVKLTPGYDDIYFAHDAWSDYRELHGELKEYNLHLSENAGFKAHRVIMSTRIGKISSYDDFYINDAGLFVIETTLNNYNDDLYKACVPQSLFTWVRAYLSVWSCDNGKEWAETFIKHNSGTYNNQYVIVDSKQLTFGVKPTKDLLWIIEQFPGTYRMSDVTEQLVNDSYFPSINVPWHEDLYNLAGYPEYVKSLGIYGPYRSYYESPRYLLMKREVPRINDFDTFKAFMRYNNYKRDNFSQGDPAQQIASRYDLRPLPSTPYGNRNNFGGLDSKCLRLKEAISKMRMHALASPPNDEKNGIPAWNFTQWNLENTPINFDGLPAFWNFTWEQFESDEFDICARKDGKEDNKKDCFARNKLCGFCYETKNCYAGSKDSPFMEKCGGGWLTETKTPSWAWPVIIVVTVIAVLVCAAIGVGHYMYIRKQKL